jgi:4-hydroxy-3-polyprenylbenzoate decarboxylase
MSTGRIVVGVTGASGAIYAQRLLMQLAPVYDQVLLIMSRQALQVAELELGVSLDRENFSTKTWLGEEHSNIKLLDSTSYFTPPASGSYRHDGMIICPCSMGTAGRIASGVSNDLMTRAADVCLKEKRPLVMVPREMPWNLIHLRNVTQLAEAGATILPASPAWYGKAQTLEDLADSVVARILQAVGLEHKLFSEWMSDDK